MCILRKSSEIFRRFYLPGILHIITEYDIIFRMLKSSPHIEIVKKQQPVWLIWDLDARFSNLEKHFRSLWVIPNDRFSKVLSLLPRGRSPIWTGGNTHIILLWDRYADRYKDGFSIAEYISKIKIEARKCWGDIDSINGNHENRMIEFLMGKWWEYITDDLRWWIDPITNKGDHIGIDELLEFGKTRKEILKNMRTDKRWQMLLNDICEMKLMMRKWSAIITHTPPSKNMLDMLAHLEERSAGDLDSMIESINAIWERTLREGFFDPKKENYYSSKKEYILLAKTFVHPLNWTVEHIARKVGK